MRTGSASHATYHTFAALGTPHITHCRVRLVQQQQMQHIECGACAGHRHIRASSSHHLIISPFHNIRIELSHHLIISYNPSQDHIISQSHHLIISSSHNLIISVSHHLRICHKGDSMNKPGVSSCTRRCVRRARADPPNKAESTKGQIQRRSGHPEMSEQLLLYIGFLSIVSMSDSTVV